MALRATIAFAPAHLEHLDLFVTALRKNGGFDHGTVDKGRTNFNCTALANRKYLVKRDFLPNVSRYLFYLEFLAGRNTILLAPGFYDRVHRDFLWKMKELCLGKKSQAKNYRRKRPDCATIAQPVPGLGAV